MKREIKFRAWVKNGLPYGESGMCNVRDLIGMGEHSIYVEIEKETSPYKDQDYWQIMPENFELMQFTGLKDKNGKEIYEGDIVGINYKRYVATIRYSFNGFKIIPTDNGEQIRWNGDTDIEVIGNIYENKDLI